MSDTEPRQNVYPHTPTTIADGTQEDVPLGGTFLLVYKADQEFTIRIDDKYILPMSQNDWFKFPDERSFKKIEVINDSGSPLTYQLKIGEGETGNNSVSVSGTLPVSNSQDVLPNVDNGQESISDTAAAVLGTNSARNTAFLKNIGSSNVYLGRADTVDEADGYLLKPDDEIKLKTTDTVYAVCKTSQTSTLAIFELLN